MSAALPVAQAAGRIVELDLAGFPQKCPPTD